MGENDIFFTHHKARTLNCLAEMVEVHMQAARALNELRACFLEHDHNRRSAMEKDPRS